MKRIKGFIKQAILLGGLLLPNFVQAQADLILVSGTDFTCAGKEKEVFTDVTAITGYLGIIKPTINVNLDVPTTTEYDDVSSDFVDGNFYAITNNPTKLDSFRLYDTKEAQWGLMLPKSNTTETVISFQVRGLSPNSPYRVEVDYCFVADYSTKWMCGYPGVTYNTGNKQVEFGSIDPKIRFVVNPDMYNLTAGMDYNFSTKASGVCQTTTLLATSQNCRPVDASGELNLNINATSQTAGIFITAIRVYAKVTPKISGVTSVCAGGENATISVGSVYLGATYQWYKDNVKLPGETGMSVVHTSDEKSAKSYDYRYEMTIPDGKGGTVGITSSVWTIEDIICCEDDNGNPKPRKLIYKNDFGTFTDDTGTEFYVWDYTDLSEPKKKYYKTTTPFRSNLPAIGIEAPEGAANTDITKADAHSLVAYISENDGSKIGWAAMCDNGKYWSTTQGDANGPFFPDHTDKLEGTGKYGAALFVNAKAGDHSQNPIRIYKQEINGICEQTKLTVICYINNFSNDANNVRVRIRAYDSKHIGDPNFGGESEIIERNAQGNDIGWKEVMVNIPKIESRSLTFEILDYASNANDKGDDLILDDILIYACSSPTVELFFDLAARTKAEETCKGDDVKLMVDETSQLKNFYGSDLAYLYQYTIVDPDDANFKKSWVNLNPTLETNPSVTVYDQLKTIIEDIKNNSVGGVFPTVYFRVVAGMKNVIQDKMNTDNYFNPDDPCSNMSISKPIELTIKCPVCTDPKDPLIASTGGKYVATENTVYLCEGESTTLETVGSIAGEKDGAPYTDYKITWLNGSTVVSSAGAPATAAPALTVNYSDVTTAGVTYKVLVHDVFEDQEGTDNCDKSATIIVKANPKPDKPSITIPNFCADATAPTVAEVQTQVGANYTINWLAADSTAGTKPVFSTIAAGATETFYLNVMDATTGCVSDSASFTVTVDTIPSEVLAAIPEFCQGDATAALPTSTKGYTVTWSGSTVLSALEGATTPQSYTYTLKDPNTECVSGDLPYTFTVKPIATLTLTVDSVCDKTTITATPVPATATVTWADASKDLVKEITDVTQLVDYSATASLAGYCDSETETVAATTLTLTQTPKGLTGGKVQYLKSDMTASVKNLVDQAIANKGQAYSGQSAGTTLYWSAQLAQGTQPGSYTDITSTSVPTPAASSLTNTNDEFYSYWIYETTGGKLDCKSEMKEVQVSILGAPAPKVRDTVYCLNDVPVALDKLGTINQADASKTYELLWTTTKGAAGTTDVPIVSTATPGKTTFYVSQAQKDANGNLVNESSQMEIIIDVYEVLAPTATPLIETCKGEQVSLSATAKTNGTHQVADAGFVWFTDTTLAGTSTAPTPNVSAVGSTSYFVGQSYELSSGQVCTGPKTEIVVKVNDTDAPAPGTVQFVAADGQSGAGAEEQFPSIVGTDKYKEEAGDYEYFYAEGTDATTKPDLSAYSTTKPAPVYDKDQLNGRTHTMYYWVYRKDTTTGCPSEPALITVNISDAMPPKVKDYYVCQDEAVPDLVAEIQPLGNAPVSQYSLIWYGTDPTSAGTPDNGSCKYTSGQTSATAGVTTYYVAQKDNSTGAVSAAMPIKVTVLANPITLVTPPEAVCETEVDLATTWSVTNVTDKLITEYLDGTKPLQTSKVAVSGAYTITNKYVNDYSNIGAISVTPQTTPGYCVGNPVDVTVTIDTLSTPLISGSLTACPGIQEELKVSAISNVASISYSWDGAITATGDKIMGGTTNSTKGQTFTYTVTATAGTCSETSAPHTITVGDGPVEGLMTATETENSLSQFKFTDDNGGQERVVYACGNELTLNVNYNNTNSVAGTEFTWYDGATSIGTGASIQIPETTSPATKTYEVKYFNKCAASAKVTVHFVPLGIDPALAEKPLTICEGDPFNLTFEHNSSAILQPQIKWFKSGTEILNETTNKFTIANTTSKDNGKYGFEISFQGCKESVTLTDLTVIPAISAKVPASPTICEGEEVDLEITNVQPQGTTISWQADATIVSGENSSKATVKPIYQGGSTHQAEYTYVAIAYNSICDSKKEYPVKVLVDEALSGSISGRNAICENESTTLNATAYDASTYTWKEGATVLAQSGVVTVKPLVTTTYEVEMTRGKCSATDNYMVEVTTNPVIVSVDSVGVRDRQVITEAGKGTAPFEFWYDENTANASVDDIFYGLTFTTHVAHVKDINGCQASYKFILDPPAINVPEFFSPNGDGVNDKWVVGSLAEVYPDALVVIYDRFGKELIQFKGGDIDGWDGTYNGVPMPSTDYWYVIDIEEIDMQYSGHFTLLRQ